MLTPVGPPASPPPPPAPVTPAPVPANSSTSGEAQNCTQPVSNQGVCVQFTTNARVTRVWTRSHAHMAWCSPQALRPQGRRTRMCRWTRTAIRCWARRMHCPQLRPTAAQRSLLAAPRAQPATWPAHRRHAWHRRSRRQQPQCRCRKCVNFLQHLAVTASAVSVAELCAAPCTVS